MFIQNNHLPGSLELDFFSEEDLFAKMDYGRSKLKLAVIGVGAMGQEHIWTALKTGRADIRGIYDPNGPSIKSAQKWFTDDSKVIKYEGLAQAVEDEIVDAFVIATPNHSHLEVATEVMKAKKPILMEKPITTTVDEAWKLAERVKNFSSVFQVGLEYRFKCSYILALDELLVRRTIGDPVMIYMVEHRFPFLDKVGQWNKFSASSGGTLVEKCCHYFDLFNVCAGPTATPFKVYASGGAASNFLDFTYRGQSADVLDHAFVMVEYDNGVKACLNECMFSYAEGKSEEMIINGTEGRIRAVDKPEHLLEIWRRGNRPSTAASVNFPDKIAKTGNHGGSTYLEHDLFYDSIERNEHNYPDVWDGLWSVAVGEAAERSIQEAKPIEVSALFEEIGVKAPKRIRQSLHYPPT